MQNFKQTKIALAVGAGLLAAAGAAQAATTTATPALRGTNPVLVTAAGNSTQNRALYDGTGYTGPLTVSLYFNTPGSSVSAGVNALLSAGNDGFHVNNVISGGGGGGGSAADDISIYYGSVAAPLTPANVNFSNATTGLSQVEAQIIFNTIGNGTTSAFRINPTGGALQFSTTPTALTSYQDVGLAFSATVAGTSNGITAFDGGYVANFTGTAVSITPITSPGSGLGYQSSSIVTATAQTSKSTAAPLAKISTHATAGLVDGVNVDTLTVATGFATTNTVISTVNVGACPAVDAGGRGIGISLGASGTIVPVTFTTPSTTADWTSGATAADNAAYSSSCFNTGITGATVPFQVTIAGGTAPTYTNVFTVAGAAAPVTTALMDNAAIADASAPVFMSAANNGGVLELVFSEPLKSISAASATVVNADDLREVAENVQLIGATTDTLAALHLNGDYNLTAALSTVSGKGQLAITGIAAADLLNGATAKTVKVLKGITVEEQDQNPLFATVDKVEATAGLTTVNGYASDLGSTSSLEILSAVASTVTPTPPTLTFENASTPGSTNTTIASIVATAVDNGASKIAKITLAFSKAVKLNTAPAHTMAELASNLVVTVTGTLGTDYNKTPTTFNIYPAAADLTLAASGLTLDIALPTALIYSRIQTLGAVTVDFKGTGANPTYPQSVLTNVNVADVGLTVARTGAEKVKLPLSLTVSGATDTLLAQTVQGTFSTSTVGDSVTAYLAEWNDAPKASNASITATAGTFNGKPYLFDAAVVSAAGVNYTKNDGTIATVAAGQTVAQGLKTISEMLLNNQVAGQTALSGVRNIVAAQTPQTVTVYMVPPVSAAVAQSNVLYLDKVNANADADTLDTAIRAAANAAGLAGAKATGADGSNNGNTFTNSGSLNAAMNAGVATALATVATQAVPDYVVEAARLAAAAPNATVSSVVSAILSTTQGRGVIQTLTLDTVKGTLSGGTSKGTVGLANATTTTLSRGLNVFGQIGATIVTTGNKFNLLAGVDLPDTDLPALKAKKYFLLLEHSSASSGVNTLLTSADPLAANFLPFNPDWTNTAGVATIIPTATTQLNLAKYRKVVPNSSATKWQLIGLGDPARGTAPTGHVASFPRAFVGMPTAGGTPVSMWTNDGAGTDMALALKANAPAVATELGDNKDTLSTIVDASFVPRSWALGWKNDADDSANELNVLQVTTAVAPTLSAGWSLVTVPASGTLAAGAADATHGVQAVLRLGAAATATTAGQTTWFVSDGGTPTVTAGESVFVFSKSGGPL